MWVKGSASSVNASLAEVKASLAEVKVESLKEEEWEDLSLWEQLSPALRGAAAGVDCYRNTVSVQMLQKHIAGRHVHTLQSNNPMHARAVQAFVAPLAASTAAASCLYLGGALAWRAWSSQR